MNGISASQIRRHMRKRKASPIPTETAASYERVRQSQPNGFKIQNTVSRGKGVFANKDFEEGEFLLTCHGELVTAEEGKRRECIERTGYRRFFQCHHSGKTVRMCVDASQDCIHEGLTLGRLVNHGSQGRRNAEMNIVVIDESPTACLFALTKIRQDEEILYDYGTPEAGLPWNIQKKMPLRGAGDVVLPVAGDGVLPSADDVVLPNDADSCVNESDVDSNPSFNIPIKLEPDDHQEMVCATSETLTLSSSIDTHPENGVPSPDVDDGNILEGSNGDAVPAEGFSSDNSDSENLPIFCQPVIKLGNKRVYNKRQACLFCGDLKTKISKHLLQTHMDKDVVAHIAALPVKSNERSKALELVRNRGNFFHNRMVLDTNEGEIILVRRPSPEEFDIEMYGPCPDCLGFYRRNDLWKHVRYQCVARSDEKLDEHHGRTVRSLKMESDVLLKKCEGATTFVRSVLESMKDDDITHICKKDPLIIELGNSRGRKCCGMDARKGRHYVAQEMRQAARLLQNLRTLDSNGKHSIDEFLTPDEFDTVIRGVQMTAGQSEQSCQDLSVRTEPMDRPSLALKIGHSLSKLGAIKRYQALMQQNKLKELEADRFLTLKEAEWPEKVSSEALTTMSQRKINKVVELPVAADIQKFSSFLREEIMRTIKQIKENGPSASLYRRCQELVLARLITFNKRHAGEVEQIKVQTYTERPHWEGSSIQEVKKHLTPLEQELMIKLDMIHTSGQNGNKVPILLPTECRPALELMLSHREAFISSTNKYLFARPGYDSNIRGCDCMRDLTSEAGLEKPHLLRSAQTRKYTATVSQILSLKDNQLEWLADHLGHSVQVPGDFYHVSEPSLELTKIAKLMLAVESGRQGSFSGKTLDEINLEDIPISVEEDDDYDDLSCSQPSTSNSK
ncbi:uncharacterized protein LOC117300650 isoform X1 [Asterias rubens]|uniref:uncharacterized protein LOC117300650 isoform X1 n=2 Tax=Asterias rubens TaxID=7604 RepID=UPI00145506F5|nr:uncharacterized protein LOC117300650 isoform X1 [Asterias rubens]